MVVMRDRINCHFFMTYLDSKLQTVAVGMGIGLCSFFAPLGFVGLIIGFSFGIVSSRWPVVCDL